MDYREKAANYKIAAIEVIKCGDLPDEKLFNAVRLLCSDYESAVASAEYADKRKEGLTIVNQSDLP